MNEPIGPGNPTEAIAGSLTAIAGYLKKHPALLFTFGMAVILLAGGALAFDNFRLVFIGVLVLTLIGMSVWLITEIRKKPAPPVTIVESGSITASGHTQLDHVKAETGSVDQAGAESQRSGSIELSGDSRIKNSEFRTGNVGEPGALDKEKQSIKKAKR